ncbi:hypothetical protein RMATCC62417_18059 [Rhizopus microsporus]|nr:hypothetical protein RMATCC62417_18059 [Rhizopus microsporus]
MNFKDLQYSISKLTTQVQSQVARNNPLQNQDTRSLNYWLFQERNELATLRTKAYQQLETNKAFMNWVNDESVKYEQDKEYRIKDVGEALCSLFNKQVELEQCYADEHRLFRRIIKLIRQREQERLDREERRRAIEDRINHLKKTNSNLDRIQEFENELATMQSIDDTAGFKKTMLKEAFYLKLNALQEYAEKLTLLAKFGKDIADGFEHPRDGIDIQVMEAMLSIDGWHSERRPTLLLFDENDDNDDAISLASTDIDGQLPVSSGSSGVNQSNTN